MRHRVRGFTLLEALIAIVVFAAILWGAAVMMLRSRSYFHTTASTTTIQTAALQTLDRITWEFHSSSPLTLTPPDPANSQYIRYQKNIGFLGGSIIWGNPWQIEFEYEPLDPFNGADDNTNGMVDEGFVQMWEDIPPYGAYPGTEDHPVVLAKDVKSLGFTLTGTRLAVDLELYGMGSDDRLLSSRVNTTVTLRN